MDSLNTEEEWQGFRDRCVSLHEIEAQEEEERRKVQEERDREGRAMRLKQQAATALEIEIDPEDQTCEVAPGVILWTDFRNELEARCLCLDCGRPRFMTVVDSRADLGKVLAKSEELREKPCPLCKQDEIEESEEVEESEEPEAVVLSEGEAHLLTGIRRMVEEMIFVEG